MPDDKTMHAARGDVELSTEIAQTVAEAVGVDPLELDPLYDVVDPEVVEQLLDTPQVSEESSITFAYAGRQVTVAGEGVIHVENQPNQN
jgi:hypothetical protein